MEPQEGLRYIELVRDKASRSWDHAYNISEDYIHPIVNGELGWHKASFASSNSEDVVENW